MKLLITIIFVLIGSILVGSTVHQLGAIGNGILRITGLFFLIGPVYYYNKKKSKK